MQQKLHMVTIEDLMPQDHFLRKLEAALNLSFVYEETQKLYSHRYGRPPIDSVVIVKYLLVGFLYGIPSERQIEPRIQTDVALRWCLGLNLSSIGTPYAERYGNRLFCAPAEDRYSDDCTVYAG